MIWITFVIGFLYFLVFIWIYWGIRTLSEDTDEEVPALTRFSIVIPFRNEAENLPELLSSLNKLNYPASLFEIIFVDDFSEDNSVEVIKDYLEIEKSLIHMRIIKNDSQTGSPKKNAITSANKLAANDWIITTDADCSLRKNWLKSFNDYILTNEKAKFICGPVMLKSYGDHLQDFQQMDTFSLQAVTWASFSWNDPFLCNGANMAYKRETFKGVKGYSGNDHISSGDDVFLLEKVKNITPESIFYLKSRKAIVSTLPEKNWEELISQRVRWAGKTKHQKSLSAKILGILVVITNLWAVFGLFIHLLWPESLYTFLVFIMIKLILDKVILNESARFFGVKIDLISYLRAAALYPLMMISVMIDSVNGRFQWKDRTFDN